MSTDQRDEGKTERFNMFMSPSEMKAIDDWAWENRIRSKSEAVRRLIALALFLDQQVRSTDGPLRDLWGTYDRAEGIAEAAKAEEPDWKSIALGLFQLLGDLAEPQATLSQTLSAMSQIAARLREDRPVSESIAAAQAAQSRALAYHKTLAAAFSELERDKK